MANEIGRYLGVSPSTEIYPCSAMSASNPIVIITATSATGGGTTIHAANADKNVDALFITIANNSGSALVAYGQPGTTATTQSIPLSIAAGAFQVFSNGNFFISNSGTFGIWTTATTGLAVTGYIARAFTSTGNF